MLESNHVISFGRNIVVTIAITGEDQLQLEDLHKIRIQFNRWLTGLKEAMDIAELHVATSEQTEADTPELLELLKEMISGKVKENQPNAVHPSGRFCTYCGVNSETAVHNKVCAVGLSESAIAKAEGRS